MQIRPWTLSFISHLLFLRKGKEIKRKIKCHQKQLDGKEAHLMKLMMVSVTPLPESPYLASRLTAFLLTPARGQVSILSFPDSIYWISTIHLYCHLWLHHLSSTWQDNSRGCSWISILQQNNRNSKPRQSIGRRTSSTKGASSEWGNITNI